TCNIEDMSKPDHGSPQQGNGGYSLSVTPTGNGNFNLAVNGNTGFKGILAYVVDSTKSRGGMFTQLPKDTQFKTCPGGSKNTITHSSPSIKTLPMTLGWSSNGKTTGNMTFRAIVVVSQYKWYMIQDLSFDLASTKPTTSSTNSTSITTSSSNDISGNTGNSSDKSQFFLVVLFTQYTLFSVIAGITLLLYILGAFLEVMLKRQQSKYRNYAKNLGGFGRDATN
ncbi:5462_t:CDS:1, partial [Ambispora leptoticha]